MNKYFIIPRNLVFGAEAKYLIAIGDALPLAGKDMAFLNFEIQCCDKKLNSAFFLYSIKEHKLWNTSFLPKSDIKKLSEIYSLDSDNGMMFAKKSYLYQSELAQKMSLYIYANMEEIVTEVIDEIIANKVDVNTLK